MCLESASWQHVGLIVLVLFNMLVNLLIYRMIKT